MSDETTWTVADTRETGKIINDLHLGWSDGQSLLTLCSNGDILVKGKLAANDQELVAALRELVGL